MHAAEILGTGQVHSQNHGSTSTAQCQTTQAIPLLSSPTQFAAGLLLFRQQQCRPIHTHVCFSQRACQRSPSLVAAAAAAGLWGSLLGRYVQVGTRTPAAAEGVGRHTPAAAAGTVVQGTPLVPAGGTLAEGGSPLLPAGCSLAEAHTRLAGRTLCVPVGPVGEVHPPHPAHHTWGVGGGDTYGTWSGKRA
jgi:hypothetical protein